MKGLEVQFISFCWIFQFLFCWVLVSLLLLSRILNVYRTELNSWFLNKVFIGISLTEFVKFRNLLMHKSKVNYPNTPWGYCSNESICTCGKSVFLLVLEICEKKTFPLWNSLKTRLIVLAEVTCTMYVNDLNLNRILS